MKVPSEVIEWVQGSASGDTYVDSTGQKWRRGETKELAPTDPEPAGRGGDLVRAARAAVESGENQNVVFSTTTVERVYD